MCAHTFRACNHVPLYIEHVCMPSLICVIIVFRNISVPDEFTCDSTHFPFFSSSPYIHPSRSSGMSRTMTSPSSKLSSVLLLPAVWGKMVRTRGLFTILLRPVATDTDLARLFSSLFPWSGREGRREERMKSHSKNTTITKI